MWRLQSEAVDQWLASKWSGPVLLCMTALCYMGVVGAGLVWDDVGLVLQNELTRSWSNLPLVFRGELWDGAPVEQGVSGYYRPLMVLSLMVDFQLWGHSTVGHHLHSLLWHLMAVGLLLRVLRETVGEPLAWPATAVFALHGAQAEAVIWVSARNDLMALSFGLIALKWALNTRPDRRRMLGVVGATILAGLAKESVLLLPGCLYILRSIRGERPSFQAYWPMLLGIAVVLCIRFALGVGGASLGTSDGWQLLAMQFHSVLGLVGQLLGAPFWLVAGYPLEWLDRLPVQRVWAGWAFLVVWIFMIFRTPGPMGRVARWGLLWFGLCLLPVLPALAAKGLFGDRYLYLSMVGFGLSLSALLRHHRWVLSSLLVAWLMSVQVKMPGWDDDHALWSATVESYPSPYSHGSLGHVMRAADRPEDALGHFILAVDDSVPYREVCPQLVGTLLALEDAWGAHSLGSWAELEKGCLTGPQARAFDSKMVMAAVWTGHIDEAKMRLIRVRNKGGAAEPLCSQVVGAASQAVDWRTAYRLGSDLFSEQVCGTDEGAEKFHGILAIASAWSDQPQTIVHHLGAALGTSGSMDGLCSTVAGVLNQEGEAASLVANYEDWFEAGCVRQSDFGTMRGEVALAALMMGRRDLAMQMVQTTHSDPTELVSVVHAVLGLLQGDRSVLDRLKVDSQAPARFESSVQALLNDVGSDTELK